jgi:signal peptidase I
MAPDNDQVMTSPLDGRIVVYRIIRYFALVALAALALKLLVLDTMVVRTDQMAPTLQDGDRVVVFKLFRIVPLASLILPIRKSPVVFLNPVLDGKPSVLRVAGLPGDSLVVSDGRLTVFKRRPVSFPLKASASGEVLPPDYSPRDSMPMYRLPKKGETVNLDSLSLRDFFFCASLVRQENPGDHCNVKPSLFLNGIPADSIFLRDFYLYKGWLDSVPSSFEYDWFFWDRLRDYLVHSQTGKDVFLAFSLMRNGAKMQEYTFTKSCIFLCADDWQKGFDSRYFGPVLASSVKGRVICVLWSFGKNSANAVRFKISRLFKIIR